MQISKDRFEYFVAGMEGTTPFNTVVRLPYKLRHADSVTQFSAELREAFGNEKVVVSNFFLLRRVSWLERRFTSARAISLKGVSEQ